MPAKLSHQPAQPVPSDTPLWQAVFDDLQRRFEQGLYKPGQVFLTLEQISHEYQVSNITARRVFRELKERNLILPQGRRGTLVTQHAGRQTIYMCVRPGESATDLGGIGYDSIFFRTFMAVLHSEGYDQRFDVKPISTDFCLRNLEVVRGATMLVALDALLKAQGRKIVVDQQRLAPLCAHGKVVLFRGMPGLIDAPVDQVGRDLGQGIHQAVEHLVARGHRRLAMLCGQPTSVWFKARYEAFIEAARQAGLTVGPQAVRFTSGVDPQEDFAALDAWMACKPRPSAVVCANDGRALHVLEYCRVQGIAVPGELAVTGFDNTVEASLAQPALTSVDGDDQRMIRTMFDLLERRLASPDSKPMCVEIPSRLLVRASS